MSWINPIFDRTNDDVNTAKENQSSETEGKGSLNANDLNRIEDNHAYLIEKLSEEGYWVEHKFRSYTEKTSVLADNGSVLETEQTYTRWFEENIPYKSEIDRIRQNLNNILQQYLTGQNFTTISYSNYMEYNEVNTIEDIELTTKSTIEEMKSQYRLCNTFMCGEGR